MTNQTLSQLPPRPNWDLTIVNNVIRAVCFKIEPLKTMLLAQAVADIYDHFFCSDGQEIVDRLVQYDWHLTPKDAQVLNEIHLLVERCLRENEALWYKQYQDIIPRLQVGDKIKEGQIIEVIEIEDFLVATYKVKKDIHDPTAPFAFVYFENAQAANNS